MVAQVLAVVGVALARAQRDSTQSPVTAGGFRLHVLLWRKPRRAAGRAGPVDGGPVAGEASVLDWAHHEARLPAWPCSLASGSMAWMSGRRAHPQELDGASGGAHVVPQLLFGCPKTYGVTREQQNQSGRRIAKQDECSPSYCIRAVSVMTSKVPFAQCHRRLYGPASRVHRMSRMRHRQRIER